MQLENGKPMVTSVDNVESENATMLGEAERDVSMDVSALIKGSKETEPEQKTNLQKMKEARENHGLGMVVDNKALAEANPDRTIVKNRSEDEGLREADEYVKEQDRLIAAAKQVAVTKQVTTPAEMVSLVDSLDRFAKDGELKVADGDKVMLRMKSEEEIVTEVTQDSIPMDPIINEEKQKIVDILIDKTGFGGDFMFTEEEREKILSSTELRVREVEEVDIKAIKIRKPSKSFIESVEEFQISSSKVPVVFPASRFRAYMTGLSYGEMGDISLNGENVTFDQLQKKLTVIYNKMVNPSIGKFENFEDFLRKFAYVDIDLAVYGLVVATFPEVDDIPLTCNSHNCGKSFNHKFSPRTLLRFEKSNDKFLSAMKDVIECAAVDADTLVEQSPTRTSQRIKLPYSNFIIEIGIASAYDYLYTIVDNMIGDKFQENHPDDVNGILQINTALLGLIRSVYVPDNDEYVEYTEFEDMIQALYMIKPEEIAILSSLLTKYQNSYSVNFELRDIVCPHCGFKTPAIPLDVNYLVFLKYQRLMSTSVNVDNITVL